MTLYEAGKLGHAHIADLCKDLSTLEGTKFEGELQEFANHAFSLRCVLECLTSGGVITDETDKTGATSLGNDEVASVTDTQLPDESGDVGICNDTSTDLHNYREESDSAELLMGSTISESSSAIFLEGCNDSVEDSNSGISSQNNNKVVLNECSDSRKEISKKHKKYRVDILRCESLAALSPATLDRLFIRDYDIVVSMVPLSPASVLPGPKGPVHFGPPCHSSMTPWMKLMLYSVTASGPISVVLMKGQCLRLLPAPLAGCEKALIWSWDGSTVGGLGGKYEGNLVKGSILLHCLNSLLKHSAVLVQPLSKEDLDENGRVVTLDIPLPLKNSDGSIACLGDELELCPEEASHLNELLTNLANKVNLWTIGYIRVLRLFKEREEKNSLPEYEWVLLGVDFGIPLFSPKLCNIMCKRVVSSQLLQSELFTEHHEAMQYMRKQLRDVCAEYHATGPISRLLYQKEQPKESSRQLMHYASGRWSPLTDPSSPISGASSEHHRLKLANRQRWKTEVMSFDGNILRCGFMTSTSFFSPTNSLILLCSD